MAKVNFSMFPIHRIFPDNYPSACYQLLNLSSAFTAALLRPSRPKPAARSGYKTAGCIKVIYTKCYNNPMNLAPFCFWADLAVLGWNLSNFCNSAKVSYFWGCFLGGTETWFIPVYCLFCLNFFSKSRNPDGKGKPDIFFKIT